MPSQYERKTDRPYANGTGRPHTPDNLKLQPLTVYLPPSTIAQLKASHPVPATFCREVIVRSVKQ